jgi:deoxyribonuclease-4
MIIGVHNSISGGISNALKECMLLNTTATQIFLHSPRMWDFKDITDEAYQFRKEIAQTTIKKVIVHSSYLITPLSKNAETVIRSRELINKELKNADMIYADYYVLHIKGNSEKPMEENIYELSDFFKKVIRTKKTKIIIENSASGIGSDFRNIMKFYNTLKNINVFGGLCLDTAHAFESGYDIRKKSGVIKILDEINDISIIKLIHLNDSKTELSSHTDRHDHIGKGHIGFDGFKNFFSFKDFDNIPLILETPKKDLKDDIKNLFAVKHITDSIKDSLK